MIVMESYSQPVGVTSTTPRLDLYDIAYDDEEPKAKLPTIFSKKHYSSVPTKVILTDATGHHFQVAVVKQDMQTFLGCGWKDVGAFYGIKAGGWVRMFYVSPGHFSINVFNQWGDPVETHLPVKNFQKGDSSRPIILDDEPEVILLRTAPNIVDLSRCISEFRKCLSYEEIVGNQLAFGCSWTSYALKKEDGNINIVDEYGYTWPCVFKHNISDPKKSCIIHGWSTFCREKKLFQSQCVKFGVLHLNSNVLYFTPCF